MQIPRGSPQELINPTGVDRGRAAEAGPGLHSSLIQPSLQLRPSGLQPPPGHLLTEREPVRPPRVRSALSHRTTGTPSPTAVRTERARSTFRIKLGKISREEKNS